MVAPAGPMYQVWRSSHVLGHCWCCLASRQDAGRASVASSRMLARLPLRRSAGCSSSAHGWCCMPAECMCACPVGADGSPCRCPWPIPAQAGTLSGNPLAMVAGIKTLEILGRPGGCLPAVALVRSFGGLVWVGGRWGSRTGFRPCCCCSSCPAHHARPPHHAPHPHLTSPPPSALTCRRLRAPGQDHQAPDQRHPGRRQGDGPRCVGGPRWDGLRGQFEGTIWEGAGGALGACCCGASCCLWRPWWPYFCCDGGRQHACGQSRAPPPSPTQSPPRPPTCVSAAMCGGSISGMFGFFFCEGPVASFEDAKAAGGRRPGWIWITATCRRHAWQESSRVATQRPLLPAPRVPPPPATRPPRQTPPSLAGSTAACWSTACTWRPASLRRASLRWRTPRRTLMPPSRRRARCSSRSERRELLGGARGALVQPLRVPPPRAGHSLCFSASPSPPRNPFLLPLLPTRHSITVLSFCSLRHCAL